MKKHQKKMFDRVFEAWEKKVGKGNVDNERLKLIIQLADTNGDGKKRIAVCGKVFLVPIDEIILNGITGLQATGYPEEKEGHA